MRTPTAAALALCLAGPALAQQTRTVEAHVHGVSTVQIAVEAGTLSFDLTSPGMDIVGFEYAATTDADKDTVAGAIGQLLRPDDIVTLPDAAGCRLTGASAQLPAGDPHHEDHDDHDHDHDDQIADEAEIETGDHSAFHATYTYACDTTDALTFVSFPFFATFPNARAIRADYITDAGAGSAEIPRTRARLDLD